MSEFTLEIITVLIYLSAWCQQGLVLMGRIKPCKPGLLLLGFSAVFFHSILLYHWIDTVSGAQNLTLFNVLSLVIWLAAVLILLFSLFKPLENLTILIFPLAMVSIGFVIWFPGNQLVATGQHPKQLIHILLSVLAFSVLSIAALQAILLAIQEYQLRHKSSGFLINKLPPLQTMESLLFQIMASGFILLSIVLLTSFLFFHNIFSPDLIHKTLLSILAWIVFAILLLGRVLGGWRGRTAIYWTLFGMAILFFSYFGSRLLLELLI